VKKLLAGALAVFMLCSLPLPGAAQVATSNPPTARVMVYAGQNPDTNETNIQWRFQRLAQGTFTRDVLASLASTGAWSNLQITPGNGLNVTVNPGPNTSQLGAVYQMGPDDSTALPPPPGAAPNQLPSDNTRIAIQATQAVASGAIGPLNGPSGSGNAIYYMIEAQLSQVNAANQSLLFVSSSGTTSFQNVNTQRQDIITYQSKAGSSGTGNCTSTFPTPPSVDSGFVEVGLVCVPHSTTQITNGMIAMFGGTNFNGFSFSSVAFGGTYASNGGATASTLSTTNNNGCGLSNGLGFVINNAGSTNNGTHILEDDLNGDLGVCGSNLTIFDQASNSTVPTITVDTPLDSGTSASEVLYPAAVQNASEVLQATCASGSICGKSGGGEKVICSNGPASTPNAAIINPQTLAGFGVAGLLIPVQNKPASTPGGIAIYWWNQTGSGIGGQTVVFNYVCL
jgi:hypothetical protein